MLELFTSQGHNLCPWVDTYHTNKIPRCGFHSCATQITPPWITWILFVNDNGFGSFCTFVCFSRTMGFLLCMCLLWPWWQTFFLHTLFFLHTFVTPFLFFDTHSFYSCAFKNFTMKKKNKKTWNTHEFSHYSHWSYFMGTKFSTKFILPWVLEQNPI